VLIYGKIYSTMYEGSMIGLGPTVFAVWGYCIAKAEPDDHTVMLNPVLLASILGTTPDDVSNAMKVLTSPDPSSKNQDHDGCRLVNTTGHEYLVVSHEHYRNMKNHSELREYNRVMKRKEREKKGVKNVKKCRGQKLTPVSVSASVSASVSSRGKELADFELFYEAYPKKQAKPKALTAYQNATDKPPVADMIEAVRNQKSSEQWTKFNGQYIPMPATWLNQERWKDKVEVECQAPKFSPLNGNEQMNMTAEQKAEYYRTGVKTCLTANQF